MNDWIQKKMTQKPNFRKRISSLTKAVGITHWLRTIKQKQSSRRSGGHVVSHRMTMRVACKTSLARKQKQSLLDQKDTANPQDEKATEDTLTDSNKELDAKYAVVLPRVKKLAKAKTTEAQQPVSYASDSPAGDSTPKARPPKPGAKLVLPSKPDLSLLKSGRNPLLEKLRSDEDVDQSARTFHDDSTKNRGTSGTRSKHQDGVSVLQAARENLKPSQIKMPVGLLGTGLGRPKGVRVEAEVAEQTQISQSFANEDTSLAVSGVPGLYEEEADREVALLMGGNGLTTITQPEFHWTGNYQMTGDPQTWLRAENLLPHQTVEKLTRWTVYDDSHAITHSTRGPWESEDPTQKMLETRLNSTQVVMPGNEGPVELDEVEDLSRLEDVSESSVLLNLKKRFDRGCIYTYIGNILLSINPFKSLDIFSEEMRHKYEGQELHKNPPHVYAIADSAFRLSQSSAQEQCIINVYRSDDSLQVVFVSPKKLL
ncbi:PREDICTED: uncharacterized protein LOC107098459 [Cyprinodon variegatus]|uniref:uncharacterized protein LOC107098459 n=1 Tax=Cyprinodon variegatus TaxID=28743 RepID=UPI0007426AD4|nr:PREDICTED: uncharacterized protein LOC107098459 [Cyprinodon variegatus]